MSRLNGAYPSVVAGVSQLPDLARTLGQHSEQVNMVSDPVRGLCRRNGSVQLSAVSVAGVQNAATAQDAALMQTSPLQVDGVQFSVTYRTGAKPGGSVLPDITAVNDSTGAQLTISRQSPDADLDLLLAGGAKAVTALGRFLVMSGNTLPVSYTTTENFLVEENQKRHIVWVRGGTYSRTFQINLIRGNNKFAVSFTTPSASYPEALDTSDLLATDPDYLKKVNDRTNVYNSAATKWAGDALALSNPEAIAARLASELTNSGILSAAGTVTVVGSSVAITDPSIEDIEVDDGGDQSLMVAAGNTVKSVETLTSVHYPGKIVRVRAQDGADAVAFYMKAVAKDGSSGEFTEVSWEETAGTTFLPTRGLCFGTVIGNTFHIGSSPATIRALTGLEFPDYQPNRVGDTTTNNPPEFLRNGRVDMLAVFQDRLMIGAKNAVNTSVIGDYLNFFRASVVTVSQSDPVNFGVIGGEEDTLRKALKFDLNLVLFGDAQQYVINGRRPFVPGQVTASVMSSIPAASGVQPVMGENYMMFVKANGTAGSLHRFRPGEVDGSPVVDEVSEELDDYIKGTPVGLEVHDTPNFAFIRTNVEANTVYVCQFKDYLNGKNAHRAWHKWTFSPTLGTLYGISSYNGYLRLLFRRNGHVIVDSIELDTAPGERPFLDSMVTNTVGVKPDAAAADSFQATGRAQGYAGCHMSRVLSLGAAAGWYGVGFPSYFVPAVPHLRDREGAPMLNGETTVQTLKLHVVDSGAVSYQLRSHGESVAAALRGNVVDPVTVDVTGTTEVWTAPQPIVVSQPPSSILTFEPSDSFVGPTVSAPESNLGPVTWEWVGAGITMVPSSGRLFPGQSQTLTMSAKVGAVSPVLGQVRNTSYGTGTTDVPLTLIAAVSASFVGKIVGDAGRVFFGENTAPSPAFTVVGAPVTARNGFVAAIALVQSFGFEGPSFTGASAPIVATFTGTGVTPITATLTGSGSVLNAENDGRFNTTPAGSQYWAPVESGGSYVTINFSRPVSAFGFYATDVGDVAGQLSVRLTDEDDVVTTRTVAHSIGGVELSGSVLFWGYINTTKKYKRVELFKTGGPLDGFGFDDFIVADLPQINQLIGPAPLQVTFESTSANATALAWDFTNNGSTDSTLSSPTFTYDTPGSYTVKLTATNPASSESATRTAYVLVT